MDSNMIKVYKNSDEKKKLEKYFCRDISLIIYSYMKNITSFDLFLLMSEKERRQHCYDFDHRYDHLL